MFIRSTQLSYLSYRRSLLILISPSHESHIELIWVTDLCQSILRPTLPSFMRKWYGVQILLESALKILAWSALLLQLNSSKEICFMRSVTYSGDDKKFWGDRNTSLMTEIFPWWLKCLVTNIFLVMKVLVKWLNEFFFWWGYLHRWRKYQPWRSLKWYLSNVRILMIVKSWVFWGGGEGQDEVTVYDARCIPEKSRANAQFQDNWTLFVMKEVAPIPVPGHSCSTPPPSWPGTRSWTCPSRNAFVQALLVTVSLKW